MATTELTAQPGATPPASKPPANLLSVGLVESFNRLPNRSKLTVMVVLAALFAMGIATFMWSRIPTYRVLFTNLSDRDGGAIVSALTQMNVPYKFAEGGGALLVPQESVHEVRLRLASQGLPRGGNVGFEMMESAKFGITQFQEQVNYQRALEGELARSIESLSAVQSARVHLAIPKSSVFLREQQKPTASVLLSLYANKTLDRAQVSGIVHLVSSSVPELTTKNVSVVDQHGSLLSSEAANDGRFDATQLAYVQQVEAGFQKRIGEILEPMLGRQNFRAQVAADIDFTQSESTDERYKPNRNPAEAAVRSEQLGESASNGQPIGPLGIPGGAIEPAARADCGADRRCSERDCRRASIALGHSRARGSHRCGEESEHDAKECGCELRSRQADPPHARPDRHHPPLVGCGGHQSQACGRCGRQKHKRGVER